MIDVSNSSSEAKLAVVTRSLSCFTKSEVGGSGFDPALRRMKQGTCALVAASYSWRVGSVSTSPRINTKPSLVAAVRTHVASDGRGLEGASPSHHQGKVKPSRVMV